MPADTCAPRSCADRCRRRRPTSAAMCRGGRGSNHDVRLFERPLRQADGSLFRPGYPLPLTTGVCLPSPGSARSSVIGFGEKQRLHGDNPEMRCVPFEHVREAFRKRYIDGDSDPKKAGDAERKAFKRAREDAAKGWALQEGKWADKDWLWRAPDKDTGQPGRFGTGHVGGQDGQTGQTGHVRESNDLVIMTGRPTER
jgi:hypothetical protein